MSVSVLFLDGMLILMGGFAALIDLYQQTDRDRQHKYSMDDFVLQLRQKQK
jgi:hypothetical protein